jgi:hypothetical protein
MAGDSNFWPQSGEMMGHIAACTDWQLGGSRTQIYKGRRPFSPSLARWGDLLKPCRPRSVAATALPRAGVTRASELRKVGPPTSRLMAPAELERGIGEGISPTGPQRSSPCRPLRRPMGPPARRFPGGS